MDHPARRVSFLKPVPVGAAVAVAVAGCAGEQTARFVFQPETPHEQYEYTIRQIGLERTALGHEWITAGREALHGALPISAPYREVGYFNPRDADAVGYRLPLERGQRLVVEVDLDGDGETLFFMDLFWLVGDIIRPNRHVANADSNSLRFAYVAERRGEYVLRLQPEMLRGGRYELTIIKTASLAFPVSGRTMEAIRSEFGASRDGGQRRHRGVDIFAPRGTPVVAAMDGFIRSTRRNRLGGKVVWLAGAHGRVYYAHLDSVAVRRGMHVEVGDTLGFVGNTGNARTTPPHLHFAVYNRGAVDPWHYLNEPASAPVALVAKVEAIGAEARAIRDSIEVRLSPGPQAVIAHYIARHTPMTVLGGTGSWYRVLLPDGTAGFVSALVIEPVTGPIRSVELAAAHIVRDRPGGAGTVMGSLHAGAEIPVLGEFDDFLYVQTPAGRNGWLSVDE